MTRSYDGAVAEQVARRAWETGAIVPQRITTALDARGLHGPAVDEACGVEEPTVDQWEAGMVYPTWEQLLALARLTGYPPNYFALPATDQVHGSWCFHFGGCDHPKVVWRFTVAARIAAGVWKVPKRNACDSVCLNRLRGPV